jgi:hypothetical protein
MYKVELFANYNLRNLLPEELRELLECHSKGSERNTIVVSFEEEKKKEQLLGLCRKYRFKYRIILKN